MLSPFCTAVLDKINLEILFSGIAGFKSDSLKPTETKEKVVLPGEDDIKTEKTIQGVLQVRIGTVNEGWGIKKSCCMLQGVAGFENEKLKNVKTREPASPSAVMQVCFIADLKVENIRTFSD